MISKTEYQTRRRGLLDALKPSSIAIIPAAPHLLRNGDSEYPYRQHSDFAYLTGFPDPQAIAIFIPGRNAGEYILFNQPKDRASEIWTGIRAGQVGAVKDFGADEAFSIDIFAEKLPELMSGCKNIYYAFGRHEKLDKQINDAITHIRDKVRSGLSAPTNIINVETILHEMRLIKSDAEISLMRRAAEISSQAHIRAMKACRPGMLEYELQAEIEYECIRQGATQQAYTPIVAGGINACTLHYVNNDAVLPDNALILIDAGGELENYASDLTRTFPINGKFNPLQRKVYEAVLKTQLAVIDIVRPGTTRDELDTLATRMITTELVALGLLSGEIDTLIRNKAYADFYMHRIGHWIGMDVHDVGAYKVDGQWRALKPGMVLTVEPGIYISPDNKNVDKKWRGIGVRIEDDVLVTQHGCEVLSKNLPKTCDDIEALMA